MMQSHESEQRTYKKQAVPYHFFLHIFKNLGHSLISSAHLKKGCSLNYPIFYDIRHCFN